MNKNRTAVLSRKFKAPLATPTDLPPRATQDLAAALNALLADIFALFLKTKNFHWHVSGPHFRDYHLMLDDHAGQLLAMTDALAERVRKIGGTTLRSIGHIARLQRIVDSDADYVEPLDMLAELPEDNQALAAHLRANPEAVQDSAGVMQDLADYERIFEGLQAQAIRWHFQIDC